MEKKSYTTDGKVAHYSKEQDINNKLSNILGKKLEYFASRVCIIASGGASNLYNVSTNPFTSTGDGIALAYNNNRTLWSFHFKTEMRTNPTVSMSNLAHLQGLGVVGGWNAASSFVNTVKFSKFGGRVDLNWSGTPFTPGHAVEMRITNDGLLGFDAEL